MNREACFELGHTLKPHGLKGSIEVFLDVDFPEEYQKLESVYVEINSKLIPFFIESIQFKKGQSAVFKFEEIDTVEAAEPLRSKSLLLPLTTLPELDDDQFYFHEVVGFKIIDKHQGEIGTVRDFYAGNAQDIMTFTYQGHEVLVPVHDDIIQRADKPNKTLYVNLPEGLIDIYLETK